jgi:hypothetical protein
MVRRPTLAFVTLAVLAAGCGSGDSLAATDDGEPPQAPVSSESEAASDDETELAAETQTETTVKIPSDSDPEDGGPDNTGPADTAAPDETTANTASDTTAPSETTPDTASDTTARPGTTTASSDTTMSDDTAATTTTSSATTTSESGDPNGSPAVGAGPIDGGLQPFIDKAVASLAAAQSISASEITVESAQVVQWPDASAGCPQPGMQYAQVITDGSAIRLTIGGASYWYHTGGANTEPARCTSPNRQSPRS